MRAVEARIPVPPFVGLIHDQTVRLLARGLTPDELVEVVAELPPHAYVPLLPDNVKVSAAPLHIVNDCVLILNVGVVATLTTILSVDVPQAFVEPTVYVPAVFTETVLVVAPVLQL